MEKMVTLEEDATEGKRQRRPVKETHGYRKFFQTTAINNGMSPLYAEFLMGHHSGGLALESYVRPSESDLLEGNDRMTGYTGIVDALTINEENRLKRKVEQLSSSNSEIEAIKQKHEQEMKAIREEMKTQQDQTVNRLLSVLVKEGKEGKTVFGKRIFKYLVNDKNARLRFGTTDCNDDDPIFFNAPAKDILVVKKALEEKGSVKTATGTTTGSS
jgi:hypothetical protein